jgi:ribosomal protein S18 acetylase RimI-like enzyme
MTVLLERVRNTGTGAIDLDTGSFNEPAVKPYHSQGFVDTGIAERGSACASSSTDGRGRGGESSANKARIDLLRKRPQA